MGAKRALIVDDSKSARLFLARALEKFDIDVDNAESAEAAIEYLSHNHPDVIFMDHLMPGMDGLQAVRVIKNDPRTATIPVMMYTSQEGELFLGQARALGAVGVLPKQIRPTDVSKVLNQLHLVSERRTVEQPSFTPVDAPAEAAAEESPAPVPSRPLTDSALREHFAELRRALVAAVDTQTDRISADMRALLAEMRALLAEMRALLKSLPPPGAVPPPPRPASSAWAWLFACAALTIALVSSALAWRTGRLLEGLTIELTQLRSQSASLAPALAPAGAGAVAPAAAAAGGAVSSSGPAPRAGVPSDGRPMVVSVPFGADPLGGARLEAIGKLLYRLARQKVAGLVDIRSFAGRFCLLGSAVDGYSLAPEETPFSKCDLVGNPPDEALTSAQRTPLALANLIDDIRISTRGALQVQVAAGEPASVLAPYPQVTSELTAGEWNRTGSVNNRIEIRVH